MVFQTYWNNLNLNLKFALFKLSISGIVFSLYGFASSFIVYSLGGDSTQFGNITGLAMIFGLFATIIIGYVSDKSRRRDVFLWIGQMFQTFGMLLMFFVDNLSIVLISNILVNIAVSFIGTNFYALIADSSISKQKNKVFAVVFLVDNLSNGFGNNISYFVFDLYGNIISLTTLRIIFQLAALIGLVELVITFGLRDARALKDSENQAPFITTMQLISKKISFFDRKVFFLPAIATLSGYFVSLGAGISIIFFPYFFNYYYGITPDILNLIFAVMIFVTAIFGMVMGFLADKFGRVKSIVILQLIAAVLLYILSVYPPLLFAIITLLVRNAFMNASSPAMNALLTDNVPQSFRARWVALQSFGWSLFYGIGNFIGGYIIDAYSFGTAFFITATLYFVGTLMLVFIKEPQFNTPDLRNQKTQLSVLASNN